MVENWKWPLLVVASMAMAIPACGPMAAGSGSDTTETATVEGRVVNTYLHRFGIIRPDATVSHEFRIANPSDTAWTIKRIESSCGCAVPTAASKTVPPRGATVVSVAYHAPNTAYGDARRHVQLTFAEPEAPAVRLLIEAAVRAPIVASPNLVRFFASRQNQRGPTSIAVTALNFTSGRWDTIQVSATEPWLTATATPAALTRTDAWHSDALQAWTISVEANTDSLADGVHPAELIISPSGATDISCKVPVEVTVVPAYSMAPGQLFFGEVRRGGVASAAMIIQFREDVPALDTSSVRVVPEGPAQGVELQWKPIGARAWDLVVRTTFADGCREFVDGHLKLSFPGNLRLKSPSGTRRA